MESIKKNRQLEAEVEALRIRLEEAEETLRAIRNNEVDALVIDGPQGQQIFTLQGAEQPYRILMETMSEGALSMTADGAILYCNQPSLGTDQDASQQGHRCVLLRFRVVARWAIARSNAARMWTRGL